MSSSAILEARAARPAFDIPAWVPPIIAKHARETINDPILVRLTIDPRMKSVWAHLTRRVSKTGLLAQPTQLKEFATISDPTKLQDIALSMLFGWVLEVAACKPRAVLRREAEEAQRERAALSLKLWAEAERLGYLEECGESPIGRARILQQAGDIMQHMSREQDSPGDIVVDRDRHRLEERGAAIAIAEACFYLFGAPLYKLSAILTTVGMDREVTAREVREWWAERPITRSADKGAFFGALSGTRIARV